MPSEMPFPIMGLIANIVVELLVIRASCRLLDIRHPFLYGTAIYALLLASFILSVTDIDNNPLRLLIGLSSMFVIPIAMSTKPMGSRILRSLLMLVGFAAGEFAAQLVFSLSTGLGNYPNTASQAPILSVAMGYIAAIYVTAITFELLIVVCNRSREQVSHAIELPIILLTACSHAVAFMLSTRVHYSNTNSPLLAVATFASAICTLSISLSTLEIAQRDIAAARDDADRIAIARQTRHIRAELSHIARHSTRVRRLRHDLANQIQTIDELLERGQTEAAGLYLSQLQTRAKNILETD